MSKKEWDREHWERWMGTVRSNQKDPDEGYGTFAGTPYQGGVFSSATYGSGAEFYSVTGMYKNPLLEKRHRSHRGKGPKGYTRPDDHIRDEVCERLARHPLIDATLIDIKVKDGEVTVSGEALNRRLKLMAEDVIDEVPGVLEIHNKIRVRRAA